MTDQPPPPPGNYPPPPPPPGGYPPAPGRGWRFPATACVWQVDPAIRAAGSTGRRNAEEAYTPWGTRALAYMIDYIPVAIIEGIGWLLLIGTRETACITDTSEYDLGEFCATGASTIGQLSICLSSLIALAT